MTVTFVKKMASWMTVTEMESVTVVNSKQSVYFDGGTNRIC